MGLVWRGIDYPSLSSRGSLWPTRKRKETLNETQCGKCKYYSEMKVYGDEGGDEEESRAFDGERRWVGCE